ncbi:protein kinase [Chitiniphilus purpureus]|uniref:Protein kinase n=1 Tax=Chitiniphilus purpureus TaxID=2981137 RepID=A0ABY6DKV8_9NEIS|nr:serine/threonine-protein kinase [Chitiniphilus sp. CD1]UXY14672.1 protein kinase [Chitiniphilus sp. CD1]
MNHEYIAHYQILDRLGKGAMGVVYRARDTRLERDVALKVLEVSSLEEQDAASYAARLLQEARSAARLNHPGIITVYDCGTWNGQPYLAMELVEGRSLKALLDRQRVLSVKQVIGLAKQMFDALGHAHDSQVVHRDIKPANLMLMPSGRLKIMDFGIAQLPTSDLTRTGTMLGSPRYMAPEQLAGQKQDGRADLFATGVVLYQALTGAQPFDGDHPVSIAYNILHSQPADPRSLQPATPAWLAELILTCLAKKREERFPDAHAALAALVRGQRGEASPSPMGDTTVIAAAPEEPLREAVPPQPSRPTDDQPSAAREHALALARLSWRGVAAASRHGWRGLRAAAIATWPHVRALSGRVRAGTPVAVAALRRGGNALAPHLRNAGQEMGKATATGWRSYRRLTPRGQLIGAAGAILVLSLGAAMLTVQPPEAREQIERAAVEPTSPLPEVKLIPVRKPDPAAEELAAAEPVYEDGAPTAARQRQLAEIYIPPQVEPLPQRQEPVIHTEPLDEAMVAEQQAPMEPERPANGLPGELRQASRELGTVLGNAWDCLRGQASCPQNPNPPADERRRP